MSTIRIIRSRTPVCALIAVAIGLLATSSSAAESAAVPSFRNQVQPVLAAAGCSSGACHGAAAGKNGFRLSLRGYDDDGDWKAITRHSLGRRIDRADPARSLLLTKATNVVPHKGGERVKIGSPEYAVLAGWLAAGAPGPQASDPRVERIEIVPPQMTVTVGSHKSIAVLAHFSDGSTQDVTAWAKYTASDSSVAVLEDAGKVKVTGHGEGAITAWYLSRIAIATVTSPYPPAAEAAATAKGDPATKAAVTDVAAVDVGQTRNFIDELVATKLRRLALPASPRSDDAEFLRRAYLDTIGVLPTAAEAKAFLADGSAGKRDKVIDALLARPEFVDYWSYKWSDLLLVSSRKLSPPAARSYYDWVREQVSANVPWDDVARKVVTASGSTLENGAGNFYVLHDDPTLMAETTSQAFLGMSINCAKCHNHPMEKWTNDQYYGFANLFARVRVKNGSAGGDFVVFAAADGDVPQPLTGRPQPPQPLDGTAISSDGSADRRAALADWLVSPANPYFSRAIANRVWANYLGVGLVEAVDDMRKTNPPSNGELLDALATYLADQKFDLKALMRAILQSETYQRSGAALPGNATDRKFYSHYFPKRLMAETTLDAISAATGSATAFANYPAGTRAMQLMDSKVDSYFLKAFGRADRELTCECERTATPSMAQALHVANGDTVNAKLKAKGNKIDALLAAKATDEAIVEDVYLSALTRFPAEAEKAKLLAELTEAKKAGPDQHREAVEDLYWGVLSSKAFLFNH